MARYFGKVCAKHPELNGERYADHHCAGCRRAERRLRYAENPKREYEAGRRWREKNPEKVREYTRQWVGKNKEKALEVARRSRLKNLDRVLAYGRNWRAENPEKYRESWQQWALANPEKCAAKSALRRARKTQASTPLTPEEKARITALYKEARRLAKETGVKHHVHHDRPLARGGKHHPDNMLVITEALNLAMGARYDSTWDYIAY